MRGRPAIAEGAWHSNAYLVQRPDEGPHELEVLREEARVDGAEVRGQQPAGEACGVGGLVFRGGVELVGW